MNKNDLKLLMFLVNDECFTQFQSKTARALAEKAELCATKVRKTMNAFINSGYVKEGLRQANARTFYVTQEGVEVFNQYTEN